ncbi:MAG TPA: HEAT repeat domain-containing protein [Polyangiales bacterium]
MKLRIVGFWGAVVLVAGGLGCGASSERARMLTLVAQGSDAAALAVYERHGARDDELLSALAQALLERDARSQDAAVRADAFAQLGFAGHRAHDVLVRLAQTGQAPLTRAQALRALARLGDHAAVERLRALTEAAEPEVVDLAYAVLDPTQDRERLLSAVTAVRAERRSAALSVLANSAAQPAVLRALVDALRRDPVAQLRAAAVFALRAQGKPAFSAVVSALSDSDERVRLVAIAVLPGIDAQAASAELARYLGAAPSAQSVEAARAWLTTSAIGKPTRAQAALAAALESDKANLRSLAATTYRALPAAQREPGVLRARLTRETVAEARFAIALALGATDPQARSVLVQLASGTNVLAVQATAELAASADRSQRARLLDWPNASAASVAVRESLARAYGQLGLLHEARKWLADPDAAVRRAAAGALLGGADAARVHR